MQIEIVTLFPEIFTSFFKIGLIGKAVEKKILRYDLIHLRDYGVGNYRKVDDYPYGGGHGMLLRFDVLAEAVEGRTRMKTVMPSPRGRPLNQMLMNDLSREKQLRLICGHYEGIDQRFIDTHVDMEVSLGDYVIASGEVASLVLIEGLARKQPGFSNNRASCEKESFEAGLLEEDHYTRPREAKGKSIPDVLESGHAKHIADWKHHNQLWNTYRRRPELMKGLSLSGQEVDHLLDEVYRENGKRSNGAKT